MDEVSDTENQIARRGIVVGVDGSPASEQALRWALDQARLTGQPVAAVTSWQVPLDYGTGALDAFDWEAYGAGTLRDTVAKVAEGADDVQVTERALRGHPVRVLLDAAADADLVVVGSRGHGGFSGMLLGSVSQQVVAHASCPVVVVHAPAEPPTPPAA